MLVIFTLKQIYTLQLVVMVFGAFICSCVCLTMFMIIPKVVKQSLWTFYVGRAWTKEELIKYADHVLHIQKMQFFSIFYGFGFLVNITSKVTISRIDLPTENAGHHFYGVL